MAQEFGAPQQQKSGLPGWAWCLIIPAGCIVLAVPILAAILFPVFSQARESARQMSCLSNLKQQALGTLQYSQDYDETFPAATTWVDTTQPYIHNERVYHCPALSSAGEQAFGYAYNSKLSRLKLEKIDVPAMTQNTYDSSNTAKNATDSVTSMPVPPRHRKGNNTSYVDGHAKWLGADAYAR